MIEKETSHGLLVAYAVPELTEGERAALWATLPKGEQDLGAAYRAARRITFAAGRIALRHALARVGAAPAHAPILRTARGAPLVASGWSGSISHKRSIACALVAPAIRGLVGVDVEPDHPPLDRIAELVLTEPEQRAFSELSGGRERVEVALRLSLKEALYKAIDPHLRRFVGFREVEAWPAPDGTARFSFSAEDARARLEADGRWLLESGHIFATARARQREPR